MIRVTKQRISLTALTIAICSAPPSWAAEENDAGVNSNYVLVTDFRGRPPFKRQRVSGEEIAELARFEETAAPQPGDSVRVVDFRGRPPFRREIVSADEFADLARFEESAASVETRRVRRGPPGKTFLRR